MTGHKRSYTDSMLTAACAAIADADNDALTYNGNDAIARGRQSRRRRSARHNPAAPADAEGSATSSVAGDDGAGVALAGSDAVDAAAGLDDFSGSRGGNGGHKRLASARGRRSARLCAVLLGATGPGKVGGNGRGDGGGDNGGDGGCDGVGGRGADKSSAGGDMIARAGRCVSFAGVVGGGQDDGDPGGADARNDRSGNPGAGGESGGAGAALDDPATLTSRAADAGRRVHGGGHESSRTLGVGEPSHTAGPTGSRPRPLFGVSPRRPGAPSQAPSKRLLEAA